MAVAEIDAAEAARRLEANGDDVGGPLLVDVREEWEFAAQRIPGAVLLPMSRLPSEYRSLPTDRPLLIHCAHGRRSLAVAEYLSRSGYPDVASVSGGIVAWEEAGLPTEEGPVVQGQGALPRI